MLYLEQFEPPADSNAVELSEILGAVSVVCGLETLTQACELLRSTLSAERWCVFVRGVSLIVYRNLGVDDPSPQFVASLRCAASTAAEAAKPPLTVKFAADLQRRATVVAVPAAFRHYEFLLISAVNRFRPWEVVLIGAPDRTLLTKIMAPGRRVSVIGSPDGIPPLAIRIDADWEHQIASATRGVGSVPDWYRIPNPAPRANAEPFHANFDFTERIAAMA